MEARYPDLKTRVQSTFIDTILIIVLMFGIAWVFDKAGQQEDDNGWVKAITFIAIWAVYEPLSMTLGCTLGNYLMKIRVRKEKANEKKINFLQALIRFVLKFSLGWISFLTMHSNSKRMAIHDFAAGSVMLEK